jgi:hypothetical protein
MVCVPQGTQTVTQGTQNVIIARNGRPQLSSVRSRASPSRIVRRTLTWAVPIESLRGRDELLTGGLVELPVTW